MPLPWSCSPASDDDATVAAADLTLDDLEPALLTEDDVGGATASTRSDDERTRIRWNRTTSTASDECREAIEAMEEGDEATDEMGVDFVDDADATVPADDRAARAADEPARRRPRRHGRVRHVAFDEDGAHRRVHASTTHDVDGLGDDAMAIDMVVAIEVARAAYGSRRELRRACGSTTASPSSVVGFGGFDETSLEAMPVDEAWVRDLADTVDGRVADALAG